MPAVKFIEFTRILWNIIDAFCLVHVANIGKDPGNSHGRMKDRQNDTKTGSSADPGSHVHHDRKEEALSLYDNWLKKSCDLIFAADDRMKKQEQIIRMQQGVIDRMEK